MNHATEEQLVLHYYGEEGGELDQHMASCEACREEYRKLQRVLNTVESLPVPDRAASYGTEVWERIGPLTGAAPRPRNWLDWGAHRRWVMAAGMAAVVVAAFFAGRYAERMPRSPAAIATAPVRERILLVAVGDHLERSQTVLAELSNLGTNSQARVDIGYERRAAEDLVESSRLYRMTAVNNGDTATASLLDELERTLVDVANGPPQVSGEQLRHLQKMLADQGILFKVRVFASQVGARQNQL